MMQLRLQSNDAAPAPVKRCGSCSRRMMRLRLLSKDATPAPVKWCGSGSSQMMRLRIQSNDAALCGTDCVTRLLTDNNVMTRNSLKSFWKQKRFLVKHIIQCFLIIVVRNWKWKVKKKVTGLRKCYAIFVLFDYFIVFNIKGWILLFMTIAQ
jgi:hypothetical protein